MSELRNNTGTTDTNMEGDDNKLMTSTADIPKSSTAEIERIKGREQTPFQQKLMSLFAEFPEERHNSICLALDSLATTFPQHTVNRMPLKESVYFFSINDVNTFTDELIGKETFITVCSRGKGNKVIKNEDREFYENLFDKLIDLEMLQRVYKINAKDNSEAKTNYAVLLSTNSKMFWQARQYIETL
jgi:hypothetical protein